MKRRWIDLRKETYAIDGVDFIRVTKTVARNLFNNGEIVGICPVNINPESIWVKIKGIPYMIKTLVTVVFSELNLTAITKIIKQIRPAE